MSGSTPSGPAPGSNARAKQTLIDNERIKIGATALNNGAVAAVVTSVIGPAAADLYGIAIPKSPYWWEFGICWLMGAVLLHIGARRLLGELEP